MRSVAMGRTPVPIWRPDGIVVWLVDCARLRRFW
jgi:hypothetical protein